MKDAVIEWLEKRNLPVTRENWEQVNWPDGNVPEDLTEDDYPPELRQQQ
jgi:hypothetical protein